MQNAYTLISASRNFSYYTKDSISDCYHFKISTEIFCCNSAEFQVKIFMVLLCISFYVLYEPRREKTGLRGFRPGLTQTGLCKLRKELDA